ncbi:MAG: ATP-binding cassette domain-containing protein [Acidobacteriota bacterium]
MLSASGATKRFGRTTALAALDLEVQRGEVFCLLGANGAGKTTTIQLFLGFQSPDAGEIRVDGIEPWREPERARKRLAYIPENVALYPDLTGLENLSLFDALAGRKRSRNEHLDALVWAGLSQPDALRAVAGYSKGMRQKVGLAIAYAKDAAALLLDEPMSGLDPQAAADFGAYVRRLRAEDRAVLMATHDIFRAQEIATRIGIMRSGRLLETVDPAQVDAREIERIYLHHMREAAGSEQAVPVEVT